MKYCIDYRNGSMGNTVLTHILYACKQVDIDLENFFNSNGNAHNISQYNKTNLIAKHLVEHPDSDVECVLEIYCNNWSELLRNKMSYSKWVEENPTLNNYHKHHINFEVKEWTTVDAWNSFYKDIKDPLWPECNRLEDVVLLPQYIQQEVQQHWQWPTASSPTTDNEFVEMLTKTYYDNFCNLGRMFESVPGIELSEYFSGDFSKLINLSKDVLKWNWDNQLSQKFFDKVLETNQKYLSWLKEIKSAVYKTLDNRDVNTDFEL